jgi:hypothetical protein
MSANPQQPNVTPITPIPMRVLIVGRIVASRTNDNGARFTTITTPAPDAYSHPSTVEVRSKQQLGAKGEDVRINCALRGYSRRFEYGDKRTGEVKRGERCEHTLDAIE